MPERLPAPEPQDGGAKHGSHEQRGYRRRRRTDPLPTVEQILRMILDLNGAIVLRMVSPQEAAAIHRNLRTLLEAQLRRDGQPGTASNHEALVDLCRRDPSALDAIASLLSDEQLEALLEEIGGRGGAT
jgi:hypothetical protein